MWCYFLTRHEAWSVRNRGIKKLSMPSFTARAGAAVQKHNRNAVWIAAFFNVKGVYLVHGEEKMPVFVDGGIKWQHVNLLWTN